MKAAPSPRAFAIAHVALLVLARALGQADDIGQWDLISFLNAQSASLGDVLGRPEVHFRNPFSFPLYNVGAESAVSTVLHKAFGAVSLYWSPVLVLLAYDALLLFLVDRLFALVLEEERARAWGWLLLSMSWVTLTFASTQAFTVQAYAVIVLALLAVELFAREQEGRGALLLALAFLLLSQGYALSFLLPYYVAAWATFRALVFGRGRILRSLPVAAVLTLAANLASHGAYLRKISPWAPFESGDVLADHEGLRSRAILFLRESFWPTVRVDGVAVGFAPCFMYVALALLLLLAVRGRLPGRVTGRQGIAAAAALGLLAGAYAPSFLNPVVKSQRSVPGDLFLALLVGLLAVSLVGRGALPPTRVLAVLVGCALASDAVYLRVVFSVDHARRHSPRFDFDLSDGIIPHDVDAAVREMKKQADGRGAVLVIVYPRGRSENTTDPAMLHARFLRFFGRFGGRPDVVFPCEYCDPRYGCPYPSRLGTECALRCCFADPRPVVEQARHSGRPVLLWWWKAAPADVPSLSLEGLRDQLGGGPLAPVRLPRSLGRWDCYEVE